MGKTAFMQMIEDIGVVWRKLSLDGEVMRSQPISKDATYPIIVGRMINRVPGNDGLSKLGSRTFAPNVHPSRPGEFLQESLRTFDMIVEFQIHAMTAAEADRLTEHLENLLEEDKGLFIEDRDIERITFIEQGEDEVLTKTSTEMIAVRSLKYLIRYQKVRGQVVSEMQRIKVQGHIR